MMAIEITSTDHRGATVEQKLEESQEERRNSITGNITRREIRLVGKAHDINRLRTACDNALKQAEARGDLDSEYVVSAAAPAENEQ